LFIKYGTKAEIITEEVLSVTPTTGQTQGIRLLGGAESVFSKNMSLNWKKLLLCALMVGLV
jgi:hypothetical protein